MRPIPPDGIVSTVETYRAKRARIRIAAVICRTKYGFVTEPVIDTLLVEHSKGGGKMLFQAEYEAHTTPYESTRARLIEELGIPARELPAIAGSCVLLGWHVHRVPEGRKHHLMTIGPEVSKLLVFVKVCVNKAFQVRDPDIADTEWVSSIRDAEERMNYMRDETKYFAELAAIKAATNWQE